MDTTLFTDESCWYAVIKYSLYLLALLNPASKIMFLSTYNPPLSRKQIFELSWKSTVAAFLILIILAGVGENILSGIFKVQIYSLRITGGLILFVIGWAAVREGRFTSKKEQELNNNSMTDLSLVPLAAPLIAGPGTITATISGTAEVGLYYTTLALIVALFINFIIMLLAPIINRILVKTHLLGPLIRLTGQIIATVAIQMIISGILECVDIALNK